MKTISKLQNFLDNVEDLKLVEDDAGIVEISGIAEYKGIECSISIKSKREISLNTSTAPSVRGTISLRDPRTGKVLNSEEKIKSGAQFVKATKDVKCASCKPDDVIQAIERCLSKLYLENVEQANLYRKRIMLPDAITPDFAAKNYAAEFVCYRYQNSADNMNKRRINTIKRVCALLPDCAMASITERQINKAVKNHSIAESSTALLKDFWGFLILKKICSGSIPIKEDAKKKSKSFQSQNDNASKLVCLSFKVWCNIIDRIYSSPLSPIGCAILMLMSGFSLNDIYNLKWSDIVVGRDHTVLVSIFRNELTGSKHDFSRELFEDAAEYVYELYHELLQRFSEAELADRYVLAREDKNERYSTKKISEEATKILRLSGADKDTIASSMNNKEPIASRILLSSYGNLLKTRCGLSEDEDTWSFLTGRAMPSSTYSAYESHTDIYARARMRQIMSLLSRPKKHSKCETVAHEGDEPIYRYRPDTTAELVRIVGTITVMPGETLSIYSPFGMNGTVKVE